MHTPEKEAKELQTKVEESNTVSLTLSQRQLGVISSVTNDKGILQDRLNDTIKREKDAVNLILEAHGVDPMSAKEVRLEEGKLVVTKHPPIEKKSKRPIPLPQRSNGEEGEED